jgi:hypothetical protein
MFLFFQVCQTLTSAARFAVDRVEVRGAHLLLQAHQGGAASLCRIRSPGSRRRNRRVRSKESGRQLYARHPGRKLKESLKEFSLILFPIETT